MPGFPLDAVRRAKAVRFLLLGWRPDQIAREIYCEVRTIYRMRNNIWMFDSPCKPHYRKIGRPRDITIAARGGLLLYLMWFPIASQDEMAWFLWEEYGISVNRSTVSRELKRVRWSKKKAARISHHRSQQIRRDYTVEMAGITAEQMVVLDETLFNESTGWRSMAWSPIGMPARYIGSRRRGVSWSLLAAYTVLGYLPCCVVKEGYFNLESFLEWLEERLLPLCNPYPGPNSVIVLDNAGAHCPDEVAYAVHRRGCIIRYLPPYSPDYSPIELSFSVLKAWVCRHFHDVWPHFQGSFGDFLLMAVQRSHYDRFAVSHFRHSGPGGYVFEGDIEVFNRELRQYEQGRRERLTE